LTGPSSACFKRIAENVLISSEPLRSRGDFAVIFGEWLSSNAEDRAPTASASTKHAVDCRVSHGTLNIKHQYFGPRLDRTSFAKSDTPIDEQGSLASL
jgi:hypothetical protein